MIALLITAIYLAGSVLGWRIGYIKGYESGRLRWSRMGHQSWHEDGVLVGAFAALLWPLALPVLLVGKHLTPTPPSVKAEERDRLVAEQARTIARLEREAGIR